MVAAVSSTVVISGVRAAMRIYAAGDAALAQHLRDMAFEIPGATLQPGQFESSIPLLVEKQRDNADFRQLIHDRGLDATFEQMERDRSAGAFQIIDQLAAEFEARNENRRLTDAQIMELLFRDEIDQWLGHDNAPPRPATRFIISLADIAFQFAATNPGLIVEGSDAEKLLGSFSSSIEAFIPDDGNFGPGQGLGGRLMQIVLRAGLQTLLDNRDVLFEEKHLQELVHATIVPVTEVFPSPGTLSDQIRWEKLGEAIIGPAFSGALTTLAENQTAFLGKRFATDKLMGALSRALLHRVASEGLEDVLTREGVVGLYVSAVQVVAERPELVLGPGDAPRDEFFRDLLSKTAGVLAADQLQFGPTLGVGLAQSALLALSENAPGLIRLDNAALEDLVEAAVQNLLTGLHDGIGDRKKLERLFSEDQLLDLGRIVFQHVAATPELLVGDNQELRAIVAGVARAMAADEALLLSGDDWLEIVAVALGEAARNPGRLFGFDPDTPERQVATIAIQTLLKSSAAAIRRGRDSGAVLFGDTLRLAIEMTIEELAGNAAGAAAALGVTGPGLPNRLESLIEEISKVVETSGADGFSKGSRDWLQLFRSLLPRLVSGEEIPPLFDASGAMTTEGEEVVAEILSGSNPFTT